jgi:hypothetical protein
MATRKININVVSYEDFHDMDFRPASKWYYRDGNGDYVFILVRDREVAAKWLAENDGKFGLRSV